MRSLQAEKTSRGELLASTDAPMLAWLSPWLSPWLLPWLSLWLSRGSVNEPLGFISALWGQVAAVLVTAAGTSDDSSRSRERACVLAARGLPSSVVAPLHFSLRQRGFELKRSPKIETVSSCR